MWRLGFHRLLAEGGWAGSALAAPSTAAAARP